MNHVCDDWRWVADGNHSLCCPLAPHQELVEAENPVLSSAAKHFFEKRHGKRFRPTIVLLMARALGAGEGLLYKREAQLAQLTEMIHVASLIHDDVLDEAETRMGDLAVHKLYNNKVRRRALSCGVPWLLN